MNQIEEEVLKVEGEGNAPKRQVSAIVIGCGQRGQGYASFAIHLPTRMKVVGVADPLEHRIKRMKELHNISDDSMVTTDWKDFVKLGKKVADFAIITTPDRLHKEPAIALAKLGYNLLLEKPMAVFEADCEEIAQVCTQANVVVAVCHVLRYFPPCLKIKEIIDSGILGELVNINHVENVGYWHFAHSFVRGNWRNEEDSTFSLLAKCCHDVDLIKFWMGDRKCTKIQSFGGVYHFKKSQAPEGATDRCLTCPSKVERNCPYSAKKLYLDNLVDGQKPHWPMSVVCDIEDHPGGYRTALTEALENGPYGRCVYSCDNDVADHQTVNFQFEGEGGPTAVLTMNAFSKQIYRLSIISGTHGELVWDGKDGDTLKLTDFRTNQVTEVTPVEKMPAGLKMGHGGADFFMINQFITAVANGENPKTMKTGVQDSWESHKLVFAAEKSRKEGNIQILI